MDRIATGAAADRRALFNEAAAMRGMNPVIIEKDFWVCWILKRLPLLLVLPKIQSLGRPYIVSRCQLRKQSAKRSMSGTGASESSVFGRYTLVSLTQTRRRLISLLW